VSWTMSANQTAPSGPETVLIAQQTSFTHRNDAVLRLLEEEFGQGEISWTLPPETRPAPTSPPRKRTRVPFWSRLFGRTDWRRLSRSTSGRSGGLERLGADRPSVKRIP
jgi:hypothetical protein